MTRRTEATRRGQRTAAWLFSLPGILFQFFFGWLPVALAFLVAFQRFYYVKPEEFVGLANFREVASDPLLVRTFANTFHYALLSLGLTFIIPIVVAILLMEMRPRVIRAMMILWFIPVASIAGILIWKYFYNPHYGLFNAVLGAAGLPRLQWLDSPRTAMLCLVLPGLIMYGPGLVYVATIQGLPAELYEAAEMEGAGFWRKIWHVTLPRMRPVIAMMLLMAVIGALQIFEQPFIMTDGGPGYATTTVGLHIYNLAFRGFKLGKATALSLVLFAVITVLVVIQRKYFKEDPDV